MKYLVCGLIFFIHALSISAQTIRKAQAFRTNFAPKIDGILDDSVWKNLIPLSSFVEFRPKPGQPERFEYRTEVKISYDDEAIYVAARMYEPNPDSIAREITARDQSGNADLFAISFDTYLDRMNANGFFVSAAGTQLDAKYSQTGNEDFKWNAVWESSVNIDRQGWTAEMKIPYSALRFSKKPVQTWGLNITRKRQNANQQLFWNPLNPNINGFINQEGELENLENIRAPLRLSFSPYVSSYVNHYPINQENLKNFSGSFNGGMDVKFGISQGFTLDLTLVPDFGQVQSDRQVLNLSPFEIKFDENRQFFTEGTELFNKGDLFYSRRVGSRPINFNSVKSQLKPGEQIIENPAVSRLLNATKVSGRTASGLGIGFFNAITQKMHAVLENDLGERRLYETQPLSNYNIMVLDQSLKNNSSITFLNTNVTRYGKTYDANVSAVVLNLNDKKNKYFVGLSGKSSHLTAKTNSQASSGYSYDIRFGKQSGQFNWNINQSLVDNKFDSNDLGILFNNNFISNRLNLQYNLNKPGTWYNRIQNWLNLEYSMRYSPNSYQSSGINLGTWLQLKSFFSFNLRTDLQFAGNDFFEPRTAGKVFKTGRSWGANLRFNSNRAKRYNAGGYIAYRSQQLLNGKGYGAGFYQNFRASNKLALGLDFGVEPRINYAGFLDLDKINNAIIFSAYDRHTVESSFDAKYTFTNRMGLTFVARHYWSDRRNKAFYTLLDNGELMSNNSFDGAGMDRNFNSFNIDMVYTWQFSPGSELSLTWKDAAYLEENSIRPGYPSNFSTTIQSPQNNNLSLKILFYVDYLNLRKRRA